MKTKKVRFDDEHDQELVPDFRNDLKNHRRPVKNWKKAWSDHENEAEEYDDFYGK